MDGMLYVLNVIAILQWNTSTDAKYEIQVTKTIVNKGDLGIKGTNFAEFYDVLQGLGVVIN